MAEDKKPKIDLKSRLQKMGGPGATPAPPGAAPSAPPVGRGGLPPPSVPPGGIPRPPGTPLDSSNPLAAAVAQAFKPSMAPAPPQQHSQRIEVDEEAVHRARSGARKQGIIVGLLFAFVLGGLGWMAGGASSDAQARLKSVKDAHDLAGDVLKAKDSLQQMSDKVTEGGKSMIGDRKFPPALAQQLSGIVVDFAGDKLFGRRFNGVPIDTSRDLFSFITRVQALNDKKDLVVNLLNRLAKPITEEFSRAPGQLAISYVVIVDKDAPGGGTRLASLVTPIQPDDKNGVPNELLFSNPLGAGNVKLPRLSSDKIPKDGAAIPVVPTSFDKVCPAKEKGQIAQLLSSMNSLIDDVQGIKPDPTIIDEPKPGLLESAQKLADALNKVN